MQTYLQTAVNPATDLAFKTLELPTGRLVSLPSDITLVIPEDDTLTPEQRCVLAYIPWHEKYLTYVPEQYQAFFLYALPQMNVRTTNVHTALSVGQLSVLLSHTPDPVDAFTIYIAVILHDIGWSSVSTAGIVASLSYSGVALSLQSQVPKRQHVLYGEAKALDLLAGYAFDEDPGIGLGDSGLSADTALKITNAIRQHDIDAPWEAGRHGDISQETYLVCDADRAWSYTHENFWQDTVRKNVEPADYLKNLDAAIDTYFFTDQGRCQAHALLEVRRTEVEALHLTLINRP